MASIIKEVLKRLGCDMFKDYCDTNGYQGTQYWILMKNDKYSMCSFTFGTCELCDSQLALAQEWRDRNDKDYSTPVPIEAYEPIVGWLVEQVNECGWCTKDHLLTKLHMHIGIGYSDEKIEDEIRKDLTNGS
jgi:hypothetical protein